MSECVCECVGMWEGRCCECVGKGDCERRGRVRGDVREEDHVMCVLVF